MALPKNLPIFLAEVFPRETAAELVASFDEIKPHSKGFFVNYAGDLMIDGKLFVGGKANANEKNSSLLAFKRELRELEITAEKLSREVEKAEQETSQARQKLIEKEEKSADLQSFIVKAEREILSQEIQSKTLVQETERAERHKRVVAEETKQIDKEISEIRVQQAEAENNAQKAENAKFAAVDTLENITKNLNDARQIVEKENVDLNEKRTLASVAAERRRSVSASLRRIETEASELESRLARQPSKLTKMRLTLKT